MAEGHKPTLNVAPFPRLGWDGYDWNGELVLRSWKGFQSRRGPYAAVSSRTPSDGTVTLRVMPPGGKAEQLPSPEQAGAYWYLLDRDEAIRDVVLSAILIAYPHMRDSYCYDDDVLEELMPAIERTEQLKELIGPSNVYVLAVARDGVAYIGFEFGCTWDSEHGLGVMTHKDRVVKIGGADVSFLEWVAEQDAGSQ